MPVKMPVTMRGWMREILGEGMTRGLVGTTVPQAETTPVVMMLEVGMMELRMMGAMNRPATATLEQIGPRTAATETATAT